MPNYVPILEPMTISASRNPVMWREFFEGRLGKEAVLETLSLPLTDGARYEFNRIGDEVISDLNKYVYNWKQKPVFRKLLKVNKIGISNKQATTTGVSVSSVNLEMAIFPDDGEGGKRFEWVDKGTKGPYKITSSGRPMPITDYHALTGSVGMHASRGVINVGGTQTRKNSTSSIFGNRTTPKKSRKNARKGTRHNDLLKIDGKPAFRPYVMHPGIAKRGFSEEVAANWRGKIAERMKAVAKQFASERARGGGNV